MMLCLRHDNGSMHTVESSKSRSVAGKVILLSILATLLAIVVSGCGKSDDNQPVQRESGGQGAVVQTASGYSFEEEQDAANAVVEFMESVKSQDSDRLSAICPSDAGCFLLDSYQWYFDMLTESGASALESALLGYSYGIDAVRVEGNRMEYNGTYRVRVSLYGYDIRNAEYVGLGGIGLGYNSGAGNLQQLGRDAQANYSKAMEAALRLESATGRECCVYLVATYSGDSWTVSPVSNQDVWNLFGNWSASEYASVVNDGTLVPSHLAKASPFSMFGRSACDSGSCNGRSC